MASLRACALLLRLGHFNALAYAAGKSDWKTVWIVVHVNHDFDGYGHVTRTDTLADKKYNRIEMKRQPSLGGDGSKLAAASRLTFGKKMKMKRLRKLPWWLGGIYLCLSLLFYFGSMGGEGHSWWPILLYPIICVCQGQTWKQETMIAWWWLRCEVGACLDHGELHMLERCIT